MFDVVVLCVSIWLLLWISFSLLTRTNVGRNIYRDFSILLLCSVVLQERCCCVRCLHYVIILHLFQSCIIPYLTNLCIKMIITSPDYHITILGLKSLQTNNSMYVYLNALCILQKKRQIMFTWYGTILPCPVPYLWASTPQFNQLDAIWVRVAIWKINTYKCICSLYQTLLKSSITKLLAQ